MNLTTLMALAFAPANTPGGFAPSADPSNVGLYYYGGSGIGVSWVNGDSAAATQIGRSFESTDDGSIAVWADVGAGTTRYETSRQGDIVIDTGASGPVRWWVRHKKNSQVSDWVKATRMVQNETAYSDTSGPSSGGGDPSGGEVE